MDDFSVGVESVIQTGVMLSKLPLERWLEELDEAEGIAPFLDPTLFIKYMNSGRDVMLKDVLTAAIALKAAIIKSQENFLIGKLK